MRWTVRPRWTCVFMTLSSCWRMTMRSVSACLLSAAHSPLTGICSICTSLNSTTPSRCPGYLPHETLRHFFLFFLSPTPTHPVHQTSFIYYELQHLCVQFTCLTVLLSNLSLGPLLVWDTLLHILLSRRRSPNSPPKIRQKNYGAPN